MARGGQGRRVILGVAAVAAVLVVRWQSGAADLFWGLFARDRAAGPGAGLEARPSAAITEELDRRLVLRGLPGVEEGVAQGRGALVGSVRLHVPGGPSKALPGVEVLVLSARSQRGAPEPVRVTTAVDGSFLFPELRAPVSYALVVRQAPYREIVRMGVGVSHGRTTDVGQILLGAPTHLVGEIVDAAGRPVAGARVQVFPDTSRPESFDLRRGLFDLQAAADPMAEAVAQGDGQFVVKDLSPGRYVLRVSAPGYAVTFRAGVRVTIDERSGAVRVVLDPGAGWYGVVSDEEGRPVAGARLVAVALPGARIERLDRVDAASGPDGAYRLDTLVPGVRYFVEAWSEGHAPTGQALIPEGVTRRDVTLPRAGRVEGRVTDSQTGAGVPQAQVTLLAGLATTLSPVSAVSDESGAYVLPHVAPGPLLLLTAKAPGYEALGQDANALAGRRIVAGETQVLDLVLTRGGTVGGRVLGPEGRPVAYASVALVEPRRRWEGEETALADADGVYLVTGLKAGTYEIRVSAPGLAPIVADEESSVVVPPDLGPVTRDLRLSAGATLLGKVLSPEGHPVPGAQVEVEAAGSATLRARVRDIATFTDPTGSFVLSGLPAGIELSLAATHESWVRVTHGPLRLTEGQRQEVLLTLRPGATLPGRVLDGHGRPVSDARVRWGHVGPEDEERVQPGDAFRADEVLGSRVLRTDADGGFKIERLEPGRLLLKVEHEGFADWYRRDLVIGAEGVQPAQSVKLEGALQIRGRVTAAEGGAPLSGVWVYAEENKPGDDQPQDPGRVRALVATQTLPDGTYLLDRLPPGLCKVAVWLALGFQGQTRRDVAPGSRGIDFALAPQPPPTPPGPR